MMENNQKNLPVEEAEDKVNKKTSEISGGYEIKNKVEADILTEVNRLQKKLRELKSPIKIRAEFNGYYCFEEIDKEYLKRQLILMANINYASGI
ncbi:hypothetical protein [Pedobacter sp. SL55]|uniref:hypothetical protein n=1 Tax=Pedobacter sp. SL55 TaxID=2995161 RepID=UPI00226E8AE2|nr:hypothetical protein [Pedobacter sp. SL55]WAC40904.1 hypothetical protein OVA16_00505 [Pedobacter sp. SL55]